MLSEAVVFYHKLLADEELARTSLALLDEGLERGKLMFGGRRLSPYLRPHFVSEEDFARVQNICETVWGAIEKVKDAAVNDELLLVEIGLNELVLALVYIDPCSTQLSPTSPLTPFSPHN